MSVPRQQTAAIGNRSLYEVQRDNDSKQDMKIAKNCVVTLNYRVTDLDGNLVDEGAEPLEYLHGGYGGIFSKIESALAGKNAGDKVEIKLNPEEAFGQYDESLVSTESISMFDFPLEVGMQLDRSTTEEGESDVNLYTVTEITDDMVVLDGNHPLAGLSLVFSCTVANVRPATTDEITHGHVQLGK